jgi:hypothetical protein
MTSILPWWKNNQKTVVNHCWSCHNIQKHSLMTSILSWYKNSAKASEIWRETMFGNVRMSRWLSGRWDDDQDVEMIIRMLRWLWGRRDDYQDVEMIIRMLRWSSGRWDDYQDVEMIIRTLRWLSGRWDDYQDVDNQRLIAPLKIENAFRMYHHDASRYFDVVKINIPWLWLWLLPIHHAS